MRKLLPIVAGLMLLCSCEYHELMEAEINSTLYTFNEDQVIGYYQTIGNAQTSNVAGDDGTTFIRVTINSTIAGNYTCENGPSPTAEIYLNYDGEVFSTKYSGSTGNIELLTSGSSLIEGYFSGTIKNLTGSYTITVANGRFSGRAS